MLFCSPLYVHFSTENHLLFSKRNLQNSLKFFLKRLEPLNHNEQRNDVDRSKLCRQVKIMSTCRNYVDRSKLYLRSKLCRQVEIMSTGRNYLDMPKLCWQVEIMSFVFLNLNLRFLLQSNLTIIKLIDLLFAFLILTDQATWQV